MVEKKKPRIHNVRGFTLVEIVAVIVIIGVIAAVVVPLTLNVIDNTKVKKAIHNEGIIQGVLERFALNNNGVYPETINELISSDSTGETYLNLIPSNPWTGTNVEGTDFVYKPSSNKKSYTLDYYDGGNTKVNHDVHCTNSTFPVDQ